MEHDHGAARRAGVGALVTLGLVAAGVLALAWAGRGGGDQHVATYGTPAPTVAPSASTAAVRPTEPPPGMDPVSGHDGQIVGYLSQADQRAVMERGEPRVQLGASAVAFHGLTVVDAAGAQVGWLLAGDVGFVSLDEVRDPDRLAEIEATWLRDQQDQNR